MNKIAFRQELEHLINRESMENGSNTPDFILAEYLAACLENFDAIIKKRENWYGRINESLDGDVPMGPIMEGD